MGLFTGLSRTDYQEVLRVVGRLLDAEGLGGLRLVERDDELILQARPADAAGGFRTWRLNDEDALALLRDAQARVGTGNLRASASTGRAGLRYQVLLRAVGRLLDTAGLRSVRLVERPDGLTVQARQGGARRGFETYRLSDADLQALVQDGLRRLGTGRLGPPEPAGRASHPRLLPSKPLPSLSATDKAPGDATLPS